MYFDCNICQKNHNNIFSSYCSVWTDTKRTTGITQIHYPSHSCFVILKHLHCGSLTGVFMWLCLLSCLVATDWFTVRGLDGDAWLHHTASAFKVRHLSFLRTSWISLKNDEPHRAPTALVTHVSADLLNLLQLLQYGFIWIVFIPTSCIWDVLVLFKYSSSEYI